MPGLLYSGAVMVPVAYGEVIGGPANNPTSGTSPNQNSGQYATSRVDNGHYRLTPRLGVAAVGAIQTDALSQCIVQVKATSALPVGNPPTGDPNNGMACATAFTAPTTGIIDIFIFDPGDPSGTLFDRDFSFLVLRSTISAPAGSPA